MSVSWRSLPPDTYIRVEYNKLGQKWKKKQYTHGFIEHISPEMLYLYFDTPHTSRIHFSVPNEYIANVVEHEVVPPTPTPTSDHQQGIAITGGGVDSSHVRKLGEMYVKMSNEMDVIRATMAKTILDIQKIATVVAKMHNS